MKPLKLVLFFTWDVSLKLWKERGLLEREVKLYERLADQGIDVTFFSWGNEEDLDIAKTLKNIRVIPLYTRLPHPQNKALRALTSLFLPWVARAEIKNADLLKTNQMWGGWCAALSKLLFRKPLLVRTGFELYQFTLKQNHGALRRGFIWLISKITYACADRIHLATPEDKDFVMRIFQQPAEKIVIQPNWIDADVFAPQKTKIKDNTVLYVGRLTQQKNLKILIDAIADTDFALDIIGSGELRSELENYAAHKKADVFFLGNFPNHELPKIYNTYPLFVLPSHYEGNPKTLLEAMSCGCAVLGTDAPGIASVIDHAKNGLLCAPDPESMKEAIEVLMTNHSLRQKLGQNARKKITDTQTLDKLTTQELASYQALS